MKVKQRMTPDPITVTPQTTHREAMRLLEENNIRRLPVLDREGRLVGMVTERDVLRTAPSEATTLSVFEIYTLLDKLTVGQIMTHPVLAVEEECSLAAAARFMVDRKIGALPVMRGEKLVGIITETDIFKTFVEVLGGGEPGMRIDLRLADEPGQLARVTQAIASVGGNIVSLTTFKGDDAEHGIISIKVSDAPDDRLRAVLEGMEVVEFRPSGQDRLLTFGK